MMINLRDHYWIIGGSSADVYQSKSNTLVAVNDQDYVDWSALNAASPIASEAELADVLKPYSLVPTWLFTAPSFIQPTPATYDKDQLKAYSSDARRRKQQGGIVVNGIPFPTDPITLGSLNAAMLYTSDKLVNDFSWKLPDGTFITLNTQQIKDLQSAVSKFGQDCFTCEDNTASAIDAGSITDLAAIDAAYAALSNIVTGTVTRRK